MASLDSGDRLREDVKIKKPLRNLYSEGENERLDIHNSPKA